MSTSTPKRPSPPASRSVLVGVAWFSAVTVTAIFGAWANSGNTDGWYAEAEKVMWTPPNAVFGPAWTILYILIAIAGWTLWRQGYSGPWQENRARGLLMLFAAQLVLNALWSPVFFAGYPMWGAIAWWLALAIILALDVLVAWLVIACMRDHLAVSLLLIPYLGWLLFATTLNAGIIVVN